MVGVWNKQAPNIIYRTQSKSSNERIAGSRILNSSETSAPLNEGGQRQC